MTIEGAPHLRKEHYSVFDCANRCGKYGERFLAPMAHVRMMAATQPFLSGAISKTVNLPNDATVEDVQDDLRAGLAPRAQGGRALPRRMQGQPAALGHGREERKEREEGRDGGGRRDHDDQRGAGSAARAGADGHVRSRRSSRCRWRRTRACTASASACRRGARGYTQEARVGGHKIFLRTGEYENGTLGEIFIDMHKEGAAFRSLMNCFAMSVSVGLQYGVPLQTYVDQFTFTRFEPQGPVEGHPYVKFATSIVDFIFRSLGVEYLHRHDLAHIKPEIDASPLDAAANQGTPPEPPSLRQIPDALTRDNQAAAAHARSDGAQRGDERDAERGREPGSGRRAERRRAARRSTRSSTR